MIKNSKDENSSENSSHEVMIGKRYRDTSGIVYQVLRIVQDASTSEQLVLFEDVINKNMRIIGVKDFLASETVQRFTYLG